MRNDERGTIWSAARREALRRPLGEAAQAARAALVAGVTAEAGALGRALGTAQAPAPVDGWWLDGAGPWDTDGGTAPGWDELGGSGLRPFGFDETDRWAR